MLSTYLKSRTAAAALSTALLVPVATLSLPGEAAAQTQVKPGFNLFSVEQDVEVGRQAASQAERQLPVLRDQRTDRYLNDLVQRLAQGAPGARYPYQVKAVNSNDINAFALPGGFMYVNRGLVGAARSEGELVGVLAHEMAHVALRHGTHQASKQYATQAGLGVLGGLIGGRGANADLVRVVGNLGLSAVFLKFTRDMETQADILGAQMMARAGYDPMEMVSFFELLQQRHGNRGGFFSDHPTPANRAARIRQEAELIGAPTRRSDAGGLRELQGDLSGRPVDRRDTRSVYDDRDARFPTSRRRDVRNVSFERPSTRMRRFEDRGGLFSIEYPDNWRVLEGRDNGVTIVPEGAVVDDGNGSTAILAGAIVNEYSPSGYDDDDDRYGRDDDRWGRDDDDRWGRDDDRDRDRDRRRDYGRVDLQTATDDVIEQIRSGNPHLRLRGQPRRETIDRGAATSVMLQGRSPVTGQQERVTVYTRQLSDGRVVYAVFVAPGQNATDLTRAYERMIASLRIDDRRAK